MKWEVVILLQKPGLLQKSFSEMYNTITLNEDTGIKFPVRLATWVQKRNNERKLKNIFKRKVDLVYSNTIANGLLLHSIGKLTNAKVLLHVHELSLVINQFGMKNQLHNLTWADALIFNSKLVKDNWKNNYGLNKPYKIIYPFITPINENGSFTQKSKGTFTIGGCGNITWRKGLESFLFVAKELSTKMTGFIFRWIGADLGSSEFQRFKYLTHILQIQDFVEFVPPTDKPEEYFKAFDLLFVSSYEEPFSLVAAECASLGVPLVCWKGCTGAEELFVPDAGIALEPGMHHEAAIKIFDLLKDTNQRKKMSENAMRIAAQNTNMEENCREMIEFVNFTMDEG